MGKNVVVAEFFGNSCGAIAPLFAVYMQTYTYIYTLEITGDKGAKRIEVVKTYRVNHCGVINLKTNYTQVCTLSHISFDI